MATGASGERGQAPGAQAGKLPLPYGLCPVQGLPGLVCTFLSPALIPYLRVCRNLHVPTGPGPTFFRLPLRVPMKTTECSW